MSEFSFENENQPVCVSVSSCLTLNVSLIFMYSLSSLINAIFIMCVTLISVDSPGVFLCLAERKLNLN